MINTNDVFIKATNLISRFIYSSGILKYCRSVYDLRLIFYHGIGNNNSPCLRYLNDEIPLENFKYHIEYLCEKYEIMSLSDALEKINDDSSVFKKPVCSISFDDGLKSVYQKAFPMLKNKNIPSTVFLNTSVIGNTSLLWTHLINYLISKFGIEKVAFLFNQYKPEILDEAPENVFLIQNWYKKNYEVLFDDELLYKVIKHLDISLSTIAKEQQLYLSWDEIDEMEKHGFTFCSHTKNHTPLAFFRNHNHRENQIYGAYSTLVEHGKNIDFVSFPFGMKSDYGEKSIECAFEAGHKYVLEVGFGTNALDRVRKSKVLARVGLGGVDSKDHALFSAIELRPKIKTTIKSIL